MTPDADPIATRETGFHSSFAKHTRNFSEYNGFWLANHFSENGAIDEYWAARESAVIMDLSPLRKFEITGPDAEALMQYCVTRNVRKMAIGQVAYSAMCYDHGGMIDDGTVYKLGNDNFRWVCGSDLSGIWLREKAEELGMTAWVRSSTDQLHNVAVQGPKAIDFSERHHLDPAYTLNRRGARRFPLYRRAYSRLPRRASGGFQNWLHWRAWV